MPISQFNEHRLYSYGDYLLWDDSERWELINGVPYSMAPAPSRVHQEISMVLSAKFFNFLQDKPCRVYTAPFDVRLIPDSINKDPFTDKDIDTVVSPDISIICDPLKLDSNGCIGAPDLIVEITSPSTIKKDIKVKFDLYEKHGVKEYWIVNPDNKTVLIFKHAAGSYGKPEMYAQDDLIQSGMFEGLEINLAELFPQDEDLV